VEVSGALRRFDFDGAFDYLDHWLGVAALDAGVQAAPKVHLLAGYTLTRIFYERLTPDEKALNGDHGDVETHAGTLGVRGTLWPKLEVLLRAGVAGTRVLEGLGDGLRPSFFALARASWEATARVRLSASYGRDFQVSQLASVQTVDRGEATLAYAFSHWVTSRVYGNVENTAPSGGAAFLRWAVGAQLDYRPYSWLALGVGYEWRARDCDLHAASFRNHRAWAHLTLIL
jgi:hypothetical protein